MDVTLSQLFTEYDLFKKVKAVTKDKARAAFGHLIKFAGDISAGQVSPALVNRWATWLSEKALNVHTGKPGLSDYTVKTTMGAAGQVFGWALRQRDVDGQCEYGLKINPFAEADPVVVDERTVRCYAEDQLRDILMVAGELSWPRDPTKTLAWYGAIQAAGDAGLRKGELGNLRWDDVDLIRGVIKIQHRPDIPGECWEWLSKGKHEGEMPISDALWATMSRLKEVRPWRYLFLSKRRMDYLLAGMPNPRKGRPGQWPLPEKVRDCPIHNWTRDFNRILRHANARRQADGREAIGAAADFHMLRKSYGTHLANSGVPEHWVQTAMRHASADTTRKHYVAVNLRQCEAAVRLAINAREY